MGVFRALQPYRFGNLKLWKCGNLRFFRFPDSPISKLPDDDWRKHYPDFNEPKLSTHLRLVERLQAIGKRHDCFPGAVAVAWTLRHPAVTAAIVGARKPEQVDDVVAVAAIRLTQSDLQEIEAGAEVAA